MNVLSLFDGMSCGHIALDRNGINVNKYYASEIDKYAVEVTKDNYPNTIHLGDVRDINASDLEKIDLLIGGSPCTDLSFAGKRRGLIADNLDNYLKLKSEGFEFEGQSFLFWEYLRLLKEIREINPDVKFLLENVRMTEQWEDLITLMLGVSPIRINSAKVSAQNRVRYYWTNIKGVTQPEDKGIVVSDILEDGSKKMGGVRGRYLVNGKRAESSVDSTAGMTIQRLEVRSDEKANCITTVKKDSVVVLDESKELYRYMTPLEYERLQTVPDNYSSCVSDNQRKRMLGNGWTVDVIAHIFSFINKPYEESINDFFGFE